MKRSRSANSQRSSGANRRPKLEMLPVILLIAGIIGLGFWSTRLLARKQSSPRAVTNQHSSDTLTAIAPVTNAAVMPETKRLPTPEEFAATVARQTNTVDLVNFGTELLNQNEFASAILCFRRALELKPDDEEIHFNLGFALAKADRLDEAAAAYREALKIFPEYPEAHINLGNVLTKQRNYEEALKEYAVALQLQPESASAHNNLGQALGQQGRAREALTNFLQAVRLNPSYVEAHFNLGAAYLKLGQTEEAVAALKETLRLSPNFPPAVQLLERAGGTSAKEPPPSAK